jgi:hypothetical protein
MSPLIVMLVACRDHQQRAAIHDWHMKPAIAAIRSAALEYRTGVARDRNLKVGIGSEPAWV